MNQKIINLRKYIQKSTSIIALTNKLDPKKRAKATNIFFNKISPLIIDKSKNFEDLTQVIDYNEKFFKVAYPKIELTKEEDEKNNQNLEKIMSEVVKMEELGINIDRKVILGNTIREALQTYSVIESKI